MQDTKVKVSNIVGQKPTNGGEWTVISPDGQVYKTRSAAESAIKTTKICERPTTVKKRARRASCGAVSDGFVPVRLADGDFSPQN